MQPRIAVIVGALMRGPRTIGHSAEFGDLFSSVPEERRTYIDGLSTVPVILFSFFTAWIFIVMLLKFKGKEVGCASGRPFVSYRPEDEPNIDHEDSIDSGRKAKDLGKNENSLASSTSSSSGDETMSNSSVKPLFSGTGGGMMERSSSDTDDGTNRCGTKLLCCRNRMKKGGNNAEAFEMNKVERRTRTSFLVFAVIAILGASLNLFFTFGPLLQAVKVLTVESPDSLILVRAWELLQLRPPDVVLNMQRRC